MSVAKNNLLFISSVVILNSSHSHIFCNIRFPTYAAPCKAVFPHCLLLIKVYYLFPLLLVSIQHTPLLFAIHLFSPDIPCQVGFPLLCVVNKNAFFMFPVISFSSAQSHNFCNKFKIPLIPCLLQVSPSLSSEANNNLLSPQFLVSFQPILLLFAINLGSSVMLLLFKQSSLIVCG